MEYTEFLGKTAIVIDNGSGVTKAGFNGEERPALVFPTYVGRPKHKKVLPTAIDSDYYVGSSPEIEKIKGALKLKYPITHGIVTNWTDMELIWKSIYSDLKASSKEHPVLLSESPLNPLSNKTETAKIFFESFNVPAIFIGVQAVLSLYSSGRTSGVILDSGDGVTYSVPVFEGFSLPHATERIDIGGREITDHLKLLLRKSGYIFHTSSEFEIVKKIKEKCCSVASVPISDDKTTDDKKHKTPYILPDGTAIELGLEKFKAPEILFQPDRIGLEYNGVHEILYNSVSKADIDMRRTLYSEIVLTGGTTKLQGFPTRFLGEVQKLAPKNLKAIDEGNLSCWLGGSILCSLNSFKKMWITRKEYDEQGERVLLQKSF